MSSAATSPTASAAGARPPTEPPASSATLPPIGPLALEASPNGLSRIRLGARHDFVAGPTSEARAIAGRALEQIREYLSGSRTSFQLPLDLGGASAFRLTVLEALLRIPYGELVTYGELAGRIGCPSARAVGQAVGWNPLPIVIPCHRVVAGDGRLGGYSGGLDRKRLLLSIEGIETLGSEFRSRIAPSR